MQFNFGTSIALKLGHECIKRSRTIKQHTDLLPKDKNTKIVVYCLGDTMSRSAASDLVDLGYTQVYDLLGGTWAFRELSQ